MKTAFPGFVLLVALGLIGCSSSAITHTPTVLSTSAPSATPQPTATFTVTPAPATKTATPKPTPTATLTPTPHPLAHLDLRIIFASDRDGKTAIYSARIDGTDLKRITDKNSAASFPSLSPDGKKIAFVSYQAGDSRLYMMDADGSNLAPISENGFNAENPAWSPDGKRLAFVSDRNGNQQIFTINADGTGERLLTNNKSSNVSPAWSPDGRWIAFSSARTGDPDIYVIRPDGTGLRQITFSKRYDGDATSWSPDGKILIFPSDRIGNFELYATNLNHSYLQRLSATTEAEFYGTLSPDGRFLLTKVFNQNNVGKIIVRDLSTGKSFEVADAALDPSKPVWFSPTSSASFTTTLIAASAIPDSTCVFSKDKDYGHTPDNPVSIGNGPQFGGAFDGFFIFTLLRGANGEAYEAKDQGSLGNAKGDVVSIYSFTAANGKSFSLYVNGSDYSIPQIPIGYKCDLLIP